MASHHSSLESIFNKLDQQIATKGTLQSCIQAVLALSSAEQSALLASAPTYTLAFADRQAFIRAAVQAFVTDDIDATLEDAANGASTAASNIFELMASFLFNCIFFDQRYGTHYTERFVPIYTVCSEASK